MPNVSPLILAGGSGTRLWPLSRSLYPKQFLRRLDGKGGSLLQETLKYLPQAEHFAAPLILCNQAHRFLVQENLLEAGVNPRAIILEPLARSTAAAIAVGALIVAGDNPEGILFVMPSDLVIQDQIGFAAAADRAIRVSAEGYLV